MRPLLSLALIVSFSAASVVAQPAAGAGAEGSIPAGVDLWTVEFGVMDLAGNPIPADFFCPGSPPFNGTIQLEGLSLEYSGPFNTGSADTVVRRMGEAPWPAVGESQEIPIQIVELSLQSVAPIVVNCGGPVEWDVRIELAGDAPQGRGQLQLTRDDPTGGQFQSLMPVGPIITFQRADDPADVRVLTGVVVPLEIGPGPWVLPSWCPSGGVDLPDFGGGPCLGADPSGRQDVPLFAPFFSASASQAQEVDHGPAAVDPDARVDASAILGRGTVVQAGARVGAGAVVGEGCVLSAGSRVGRDARIGSFTTIGPGARVGAGSFVGDACLVGPDSVLQRGCVVNDGSTLGTACRLGGGARLGADCQLGDDVKIGGRTTCGNDVVIAEGTSVSGGLYLTDGSTVGGDRWTDDIFTCDFGASSEPLLIEECETLGGVVIGLVDEIYTGIEPLFFDHLELDPALLADIDLATARTKLDESGIPDRKYVKDKHDCDDFAGEAEQLLQDCGFDATFTVLWEWNGKAKWSSGKWVGEWQKCHAVVDLHLPDGSTAWLEPQLRSDENNLLDLDCDGDGTVGTASSHGSALTEGNKRIEVYDNRKAAEDAGVVMD